MENSIKTPLILTFLSGKEPDVLIDYDLIPIPISGTLCISGGNIIAKLEILTSHPLFKYGGECRTIESGGYKGIVFTYYHSTITSRPDIGRHNYSIPIPFSVSTPDGWKEGDMVRVMFLNEDEPAIFDKLIPYFELRLKEFGYKLPPFSKYKEFNMRWNKSNPQNRVYDDSVSYREDEKSGEKALGRSYAMPRFTKDDGVLSLSKNC